MNKNDSILLKAEPNKHYLDTLKKKINGIHENVTRRQNHLLENFTASSDSTSRKIAALKGSLQQRIDSLTEKGFHSDSLQHELQNILNSPEQKLENLLAFQERLKTEVSKKIPDLDTLRHFQNILKEKADIVDEISTEAGIGPLGKGLLPNGNASTPDIGLPSSPDIDVNVMKEVPSLPQTPDLSLNKKMSNLDLNNPAGKISKETEALAEKTSKVTDVVKEAGELVKEAEGYQTDIKKVQEEGILRSEKLDELAEKEALRIDELKAFKEQNKGIEEMEAYENLIERYKNEKRIEEEMKAKVKELANDVILENNGKVNEVMKKISKYKRKFSDVPDMRNLPKRAPNPLKGLTWQDRLVPGLTLQTINSKKSWIELDPQVYYKLNASWSTGVGGMYRFSMNPDKITFDDFGSMYGGKAFTQYSAFKGFFVRGEVQFAKWKPWRWSISDPEYVDKTYVGAVGIGKSYMLAKRIKGNAQTLYHWHWKGLDPYKPKILIRLGFDFSLQKKKEKPWAKRLKELKKSN